MRVKHSLQDRTRPTIRAHTTSLFESQTYIRDALAGLQDEYHQVHAKTRPF